MTTAADSEKTLAVAVDFNDNVASPHPSPKRMYTPDEVVKMISYFKDLGVGRLYWFHDAHNGLYKDVFAGDETLLAFACRTAHEHGMDFFSVIKPFETGLQGATIPPHLEAPAHATRTVQGWHVFASQFAADHPEMRLAFAEASPEAPGSGRVRRVELVSQDDTPCDMNHEDVKLLWSDKNSCFAEYEGPVEYSSFVREDGENRQNVFVWDNLDLPEEARYILLRYNGENGDGNFVNLPSDMLKLYDESGQLCSQAEQGKAPMRRDALLSWQIDLPESTRSIVEDPEQCAEAFENHFKFENNRFAPSPRSFNKQGGFVCHTLNFNTHCPGALHPGYPEVREYWLERVRASLDAGVDGVALRIANHSSHTSRPFSAGFNEPAVREYARRTGTDPDPRDMDLQLLRHINAEFYTQFLRHAQEEIRARGKKIQHFIQPLMDGLQTNLVNNIPGTFFFPYREWLMDGLLDGLCLRPMGVGKPPEAHRFFGDMVGAQARWFNVEMFHTNANGQLNKACVENEIPEYLRDDLEHVRTSDLFDGFTLYEAAGVMGIDEEGQMQTSSTLEEAIRSNWRGE